MRLDVNPEKLAETFAEAVRQLEDKTADRKPPLRVLREIAMTGHVAAGHRLAHELVWDAPPEFSESVDQWVIAAYQTGEPVPLDALLKQLAKAGDYERLQTLRYRRAAFDSGRVVSDGQSDASTQAAAAAETGPAGEPQRTANPPETNPKSVPRQTATQTARQGAPDGFRGKPTAPHGTGKPAQQPRRRPAGFLAGATAAILVAGLGLIVFQQSDHQTEVQNSGGTQSAAEKDAAVAAVSAARQINGPAYSALRTTARIGLNNHSAYDLGRRHAAAVTAAALGAAAASRLDDLESLERLIISQNKSLQKMKAAN